MAIEDKKDDVIEDDDLELDIDDEEEEDDDTEDDPEDPKAKGKDDKGKDKGTDRKDETPEARSARLRRQADRHDKKHGLGKYAEKKDKGEVPAKKDDKKSGELDWGQKAFLTSSDLKIKGKKEFALVQEYLDNGKDIEDIIENRHFQNDLKDLREGTATKGAVPKGTRRSQNSTSSDVDYWLAKGGLPENTPENQKLRREIVNARIKAETSTNVFTDKPVAGRGR